jgi:hypothetical protein
LLFHSPFPFAALLFVLSLGAAAQEEVRGRIFHIEGDDLSVTTRDGPRRIFKEDIPDFRAELLNDGDMVQTGPACFAEIQFVPGGTVLKIAENTTLVFQGGSGPIVLSLLYGRLRLVTGTEPQSFSVQTGGAAVELAEGDFCIDYMVLPDQFFEDTGGAARPRLRIYDFRGEAGISLLPNGADGRAPYMAGDVPVRLSVIPVRAAEMVSLEISSSLHFVERKPIHADIADYWNRYPFQGSPPLMMPVTALALMNDSPPPSVPAPAESGGRRLRMLLKNDAIIFGLSLAGIGAGMQGYGASALHAGNYDTAREMIGWGFLPMGMGLVFLISSLFFNPVSP